MWELVGLIFLSLGAFGWCDVMRQKNIREEIPFSNFCRLKARHFGRIQDACPHIPRTEK